MKGLEVIEMKPVGEYWQIRTALNGHPAVPFDVHKSIRDRYQTSADFENYLGKQTLTLLTIYGDAREGRAASSEFVM